MNENNIDVLVFVRYSSKWPMRIGEVIWTAEDGKSSLQIVDKSNYQIWRGVLLCQLFNPFISELQLIKPKRK